MTALAWIVSALALALAWAGLLVVELIVDEDVNHWEWPTDSGPGWRTTTFYVVRSGLIALVGVAAVVAVIKAVLQARLNMHNGPS